MEADTPSVSQTFAEGFARGLLLAWPIWALIGAMALGGTAVGLYRRGRLSRSGMDDIDRMPGRVFEQYLQVLFTKLGYTVERTRFVGDFGGDLVLSKGGGRMIVQAKRWTRTVGVRAVQEAVAAKAHYGCDSAMVVTNRHYSKQARSLARSNGIGLWDRDGLRSKISSLNVRASLDATIPAGAIDERAVAPGRSPDPNGDRSSVDTGVAAICSVCARAVSEGVREYCATNRERFGGKVLCFVHQREVRRR